MTERRGKLYRYQLLREDDEWLLKCSFHSYKTLREAELPEQPKDGQVYHVSWPDDNIHAIALKPCDDAPGETFTYPIGINQLGTDDELEVHCEVLGDWGWSPWVRLRGITLGEGGPTYGPAIQFIEDLISDPDEHFVVTLSFVEVTGRKDMDRDLLLGDFYHLKGDVSNEEVAARGRFLNRELVERGMARVLG